MIMTKCSSQVHHHTLDKLDQQLLPLMQRGVAWYTGLARVLRAKYGQLCRQFSSEDGKVCIQISDGPSQLSTNEHILTSNLRCNILWF